MELFVAKTKIFRKDIIEENSLVVTISLRNILSWQKYIKNNGMSKYW